METGTNTGISFLLCLIVPANEVFFSKSFNARLTLLKKLCKVILYPRPKKCSISDMTT